MPGFDSLWGLLPNELDIGIRLFVVLAILLHALAIIVWAYFACFAPGKRQNLKPQ